MATEKEKRLQDRAQSLLSKLNTIDLQEQEEFIDGVLKEIETPVVRIPEPVFREIFLPYFVGDKLPDEQHNPIAHWAGLVGSASEPADVVGINGEKLFTVPPMYDTSKINPLYHGPDTHGFASIYTEYVEQSRVHRERGLSYFVTELAKKADEMLPEGRPDQYSWKPVLDYYHLSDKGPADRPVGEPSSISDDDLDFE